MAGETTQSGTSTVPSNQPTGTATLQIIGDQGSTGSATYTASHSVTTESRRVVTTVSRYYDPLAETFSLTEGRYIGGIDLWFTAKGSSRVTVQIRDTMVGYPNKNVLAQATLYPSSIKTNGTATRFTFKPVWLESDTEYAIVILTDDSTTAVAISELGQYDPVHRKYVTKQPNAMSPRIEKAALRNYKYLPKLLHYRQVVLDLQKEVLDFKQLVWEMTYESALNL